jgi:hypothetical protein
VNTVATLLSLNAAMLLGSTIYDPWGYCCFVRSRGNGIVVLQFGARANGSRSMTRDP